MRQNNTNIRWVNIGRALSMLGIYVAHCNFYYLDLDSNIMSFSNLFRIPFFYFISGFLFFRSLEIYSHKQKFEKIANKLIWPALLFPALIWIPKTVAHGNDIDIWLFFKDIFGGTATWFISSIIVGQLLLLCLTKWVKNIHTVFGIAFCLFLAAFYLTSIDPNPFPWYYKSGLIATLFLSLGGVYHKNQDKLKICISKWILIASCILSVIMHIYTSEKGIYNNIMTAQYENILLGLFNNLTGIIFMLNLCHYLPSIKWLEYIGKNSIVFYFLAGGVPLVIGYLAKTFIPFQGYLMTILVTALSVILIFPITYFINNYCSWTLDFSKISGKLRQLKNS